MSCVQGLEPYCGVHIVAQQHLTRLQSSLSIASMASRNRPAPTTQDRVSAGFDGVFAVFRQWPCSVAFSFAGL